MCAGGGGGHGCVEDVEGGWRGDSGEGRSS